MSSKITGLAAITSVEDADLLTVVDDPSGTPLNVKVTKQNFLQAGIASGLAQLDAGGKVPAAQLPDSVVGAMEYKGVWDASGGVYPTPVGLEQGWYYVISVAGTMGGVDYEIGDWAAYNGTTWDKIDNSDKVSSVNSYTGVVVLDADDIAETATRKWDRTYSEAFTSQTSVIVTHNLGKYPSTMVIDSGGSEVVTNKVHNSINQVTVSWSGSTSGTIFCN